MASRYHPINDRSSTIQPAFSLSCARRPASPLRSVACELGKAGKALGKKEKNTKILKFHPNSMQDTWKTRERHITIQQKSMDMLTKKMKEHQKSQSPKMMKWSILGHVMILATPNMRRVFSAPHAPHKRWNRKRTCLCRNLDTAATRKL